VTGYQKIAAFLRQALIILAFMVAAIYIGDYLWLRFRMAYRSAGNPFGAVPMQSLVAVPLKGGKIEYDINQAQAGKTQTCIHALFPHSGYSPCWYVVRENRGPVPMVLLP
jgi:hypothetical protein